jgi:D-alanyl-D-alanine carboxypeptidase/D-alanyl-D-alanine-endopeptidase (penicillin-binding protein 4)
VVALLAYLAKSRHGPFIREALPRLGVDGTLMFSGRDSPARGKIDAKTGTLITVDLLNDSAIMDSKSLAGYMTTAAGREVVFVIFVNYVHSTDVRGREETRRFTGETGADLLKIAEALYRADGDRQSR